MIYRGANQRVPEFHSWVCLCIGLGARSYVELGCGSAHFLQQAGVEKVVTVDLLRNGIGGIEHIEGNSHDPAVLARVLTLLGDQPDIVFIDADHGWEAVEKDFNLWWPATRLAVGFHDVLMVSVVPAWQKLSRAYPSVELVSRDVASANAWQRGSNSDGDVHVGGIGVLFKECQ